MALGADRAELQVPPLRFAPVGMTSWGWRVQCAVASGV
jgi:hypothetical protein